MKRLHKNFFFLVYCWAYFTSLSIFVGCGSSYPSVSPDTQCGPEVAQIQIGDGFLRIFCGCTQPGENPGAVFRSGQELVCHLPTQNSQVIFYFLNNFIPHQVVSTGPNTFISSSVIQSRSLTSHVVRFHVPSSTYGFVDSFTAITGKIIVP